MCVVWCVVLCCICSKTPEKGQTLIIEQGKNIVKVAREIQTTWETLGTL